MGYYKEQLAKLDLNAPTISIKLHDFNGASTNQFNLNLDSIRELRLFLDKLESIQLAEIELKLAELKKDK